VSPEDFFDPILDPVRYGAGLIPGPAGAGTAK
jgi:hypothetical protein